MFIPLANGEKLRKVAARQHKLRAGGACGRAHRRARRVDERSRTVAAKRAERRAGGGRGRRPIAAIGGVAVRRRVEARIVRLVQMHVAHVQKRHIRPRHARRRLRRGTLHRQRQRRHSGRRGIGGRGRRLPVERQQAGVAQHDEHGDGERDADDARRRRRREPPPARRGARLERVGVQQPLLIVVVAHTIFPLRIILERLSPSLLLLTFGSGEQAEPAECCLSLLFHFSNLKMLQINDESFRRIQQCVLAGLAITVCLVTVVRDSLDRWQQQRLLFFRKELVIAVNGFENVCDLHVDTDNVVSQQSVDGVFAINDAVDRQNCGSLRFVPHYEVIAHVSPNIFAANLAGRRKHLTVPLQNSV